MRTGAPAEETAGSEVEGGGKPSRGRWKGRGEERSGIGEGGTR